ncbi:hypothetical protein HMPREF9418_1291 [Neisseria macacae ATCC 33926]|uniref:Uncharacterized protein n=1 Tax=Neisseria macacae ATCC 33926 TaxID=997348 RepID=A0AA36UK41_9NEIS|nr:hypothetical protein HMPREF9418_1291 [Neisseria macacae ATCC 33926]
MDCARGRLKTVADFQTTSATNKICNTDTLKNQKTFNIIINK